VSTPRPVTARRTIESGLQYGLEVYSPVDDDGKFTEDVPFSRVNLFLMPIRRSSEADGGRALLKEEKMEHTYPIVGEPTIPSSFERPNNGSSPWRRTD